MSYSNVGKVWDAQGFADYLASLPALGWAKAVCVHHTAYPDLAMRPKGWTIQHMRNLADYYGKQLGWSAGPHLFTDEDQIFGLSPLNAPGTHAKSFNRYAIGIEMLGNYDKDDPESGRGAEVLRTSIECVAVLLKKLGLEATEETILFHRDDPKTTKTCPGGKVGKLWFVSEVARVMEGRGDESEPMTEPDIENGDLAECIKAMEWQLHKLKSLI